MSYWVLLEWSNISFSPNSAIRYPFCVLLSIWPWHLHRIMTSEHDCDLVIWPLPLSLYSSNIIRRIDQTCLKLMPPCMIVYVVYLMEMPFDLDPVTLTFEYQFNTRLQVIWNHFVCNLFHICICLGTLYIRDGNFETHFILFLLNDLVMNLIATFFKNYYAINVHILLQNLKGIIRAKYVPLKAILNPWMY